MEGHKETAQLCKCNNCGAVMYDENPDDQPELVVPKGVLQMEHIEDTEDGDDERSFFWGCPNCKTDGYLVDVMEL